MKIFRMETEASTDSSRKVSLLGSKHTEEKGGGSDGTVV